LDVIHGFKTVFPVPLGEAASWDLESIQRSARIAALEASSSGLHWTFAPMVDIARDPRWGRVMEGAGEDPYLGSLIGIGASRGIGLMFVIIGGMAILTALGGFLYPRLRKVEHELPDIE
jgi:beta-glucosidase